jgi:hypothetical protein
LFAEVEKIVSQRARLLSGRLMAQREHCSEHRQKLATLSAIMRRGEAAPAYEQ